MGILVRSKPHANDISPAPAGDQTPTPAANRREVHAAYHRGRRDGARRPRGSPLFAFLALVAIAGLALLVYLAVHTGSFANGGAVIDQRLSNASQTVQAPIQRAEDKAGTALERTGQDLKRQAGDQPPAQQPPAQ
jgi:hypothetical protein